MIQLKSWCPATVHALKFTPATCRRVPAERLGANRSPLPPGRRRKHLALVGARRAPAPTLARLLVKSGPTVRGSLEPAAEDLRAETTLRGCRTPARGSVLPSTSSAPPASPSFSLLACFFLPLTCHHLKVSSERALFSLLISGWMERLKRSVNQGSSSGSVMQRPQAQCPLGGPQKAEVKESREESSQV